MRLPQPSRRLEVGHARAETFGDGFGRCLGAGFQPGNGILRAGEGGQQRMIVIGLRRRFARAGRARRFEVCLVLDFPCRPEPVFVVFFGISRQISSKSLIP